MKRIFSLIAAIALAISLTGCGERIETGHTGIYTSWSKKVSPDEYGPGWHWTFPGSLTEYVTSEMTLQINDQHPVTKDKTVLSDFDLTYMYVIESDKLSEMHTTYKGRHLKMEDGSIYPMGLYVQNAVTSAIPRAISKFDALEANDNRPTIESDIARLANERFKQEGLDGMIKVKQVMINNLVIDRKLNDAILGVSVAKKENEKKDIEIDTAKKEAMRIQALSQSKDRSYIDLLNAQSTMKIAEGVANGKVNTVIIPQDFKGMVSIK